MCVSDGGCVWVVAVVCGSWQLCVGHGGCVGRGGCVWVMAVVWWLCVGHGGCVVVVCVS